MDNNIDLFQLAGVRKNDQHDCWEFVSSTATAVSTSQTSPEKAKKPRQNNKRAGSKKENTSQGDESGSTTTNKRQTRSSSTVTTTSTTTATTVANGIISTNDHTTANKTAVRIPTSAPSSPTKESPASPSTSMSIPPSKQASPQKSASPLPAATTTTTTAAILVETVTPAQTNNTPVEEENKRKRTRGGKQHQKRANTHNTTNNANNTMATTGSNKTTGPRVRWGQVEEYCFTRSLSYDAVPSKGLYPLGLGELVEQCCFTVDELFAQQQFQQILAAQQASLQVPPPPPVPITSPTTSSKQKKTSTSTTTTTTTTTSTTNTTVLSKSRERKDSFDLTQSDHSSTSTSTSTSTTTETVSLSRSPQVKAEYERMQLLRDASKQNTDAGKGLHQELETIRKSREHYGCSCKPIKLDKLNVAKLKSELQHRRHLIVNPSFTEDVEKLKKTELMHYLKEALKACPSCIVDQCECIEAGIPCSANACDCVYRPGEPESCENPLGNKSYNEEHVKEYRQRILAQVKMSLQMDEVAMEDKHQ